MSKTRFQALGPLLSGEGSRAFLGLALHESAPAQPVVMVWVPPETAQDIEQVTQIHKETQRAITLEHPNIIRVHALAALEEGLARVVEFADGESLRRVLEVCQKLPLPFAALVIAEAATGLHYAHLAGNDDGSALVHGDLRPETLMVCFSGFTKVAGYGALTVAPRESGGKRVVHRRLYAAPEQIIGGRNAISVPTDVYLLGITLFECLTGQMPFQGEANFDQAIVNTPLRLTDNPDIPADLVPVLQRATAKRSSDRYASALAMREALVQAVGPLPTHEEFAAYLQEHFPVDDAARAARRRVLEAGLAEDNRRLAELKGPTAVAQPPAALSPQAAVPARPAPAAAAPAPSAPARAAPRASSAALPAAKPRPSSAGRAPSPPPPEQARPASRPYVPMAIAAVLGAAAAIAYVRQTSASRAPTAPKTQGTDAPSASSPPPAASPSAPPAAPVGEPRSVPVPPRPSPKPHPDAQAVASAVEAPPTAPVHPAAFHKAEPSELELSVVPPVDVSVDGHPVGRSPVTVTLAGGRHTLGFRDRELGINTRRNYLMSGHGKQSSHVALGKGFLTVAIPPGSIIFLDGHEVSRSSITDQPIYEGGHQLVVSFGQAKWRQSFDVRPDEHMSYNVQTEQQPAALP